MGRDTGAFGDLRELQRCRVLGRPRKLPNSSGSIVAEEGSREKLFGLRLLLHGKLRAGGT